MKTIETKVYEYDELNEKAQEKARDWLRYQMEYNWADEAMDSIKALAAHFGGKMKNWQIDWFDNSPSQASFEMPEMEKADIATLLGQLGTYNTETLKGHGDCKLTGVCHDESAIDGFRMAFYKGETDLEKLMDAAFDSWLKDVHSDASYQISDEGVEESIRCNGYTFTEDGKRF